MANVRYKDHTAASVAIIATDRFPFDKDAGAGSFATRYATGTQLKTWAQDGLSAVYQPLDATLTALAALNSTAGLVEQTGADAFTKRLIGVANATDIPTRADADARFAALSHTHTVSEIADIAANYQPLNANLTVIGGLADPDADRILFWDDSAGAYAHLTLGANLAITGTTIDASGTGTVNSGAAGAIAYYPGAGTTVDDTAGFSYSATADATLSATPASGKTGMVIYQPTSTPPATVGGRPVLQHLHAINVNNYWLQGFTSDATTYEWVTYIHETGSGTFVFGGRDAGAQQDFSFSLQPNSTNEAQWLFHPEGVQFFVNSATYYGGIAEVASDQFGLMLTTSTPTSGAIFPLTWRATGITQLAPATALADGDITANHLHFFQDETTNELKAKWKESGGSVNSITFSSGSGITIGTTAVTSGTGGRFIYETTGNVVGEISTLTSDGTIVTFSPTVTTGTGATSGLNATANSLTTGTAFHFSSSSITSGSIVNIASTSTAGATGMEALNIAVSGANGTSAQTITGATISVTNTNATSGTNKALVLTASGATTANYGLEVTAGQIIANTGTITTSQPALDLAQTWNNSGTIFTGLKSNVTATASASGSMLADFQVGGTSVIKLTRSGAVQITDPGFSAYSFETTAVSAFRADNSGFALTSAKVNLKNSSVIAWSSTGNWYDTTDTGLARLAAGVIRASNSSTGAGSFVLGTSTVGSIGTSGVGVLAIANGTAPSSSPADEFQLYSADWNGAGTAAAHFRNEEGHIIKMCSQAVAALTNNVTSGGTTDTIDNYTDLTVYAMDAAAIRNNLYQLARKLAEVVTALRTAGNFR